MIRARGYRSGFVSLRRPAQRRQVHAHQRAGRPEDRDHQRQAADHPDRRARHRAPARRPADPGRHPGAAPAAHAARRAAQRPGAHHLGRGRRGRACASPATRRSGRATGSSSPSWPRCGARPSSRSPPRPTWPRPSGSASTCSTSSARPGDRHRVGRDRAGVGGRRRPGVAARRPAGRAAARRARQLYPDGDLTDAPEEILVAELIREAALDGVRDELPHSIAVRRRGDGAARGAGRGQAAARHPRQPVRRARRRRRAS